jgi:SPP1 family predicted phage head-tail adaptor
MAMSTTAKKRLTLMHQRLFEPETVQDASEQTEQWIHLRTLRAEIIPAGGGNEVFAQNEMQPIQTFSFKIHHLDDIKAGDRLVDRNDGDVYHVMTAKNMEGRGRETMIRVREWQG